jgi:hypothetical protein
VGSKGMVACVLLAKLNCLITKRDVLLDVFIVIGMINNETFIVIVMKLKFDYKIIEKDRCKK